MALAGSLVVLPLLLLVQSFPHTVPLYHQPQFHLTQTSPPLLHLLYERGTSLLQRLIYLGLEYFSGPVRHATT